MDGKAKGRVRYNSPISSLPTPGVGDWKAQDKSYFSLAHVSLGQDCSPQGHDVPPFPWISVPGECGPTSECISTELLPGLAQQPRHKYKEIAENRETLPLPTARPPSRAGMPALAEWTFGKIQYYEPHTHWHQHKTPFMMTSNIFYPHFSHDKTKAGWAWRSLWDEHQNAWKPPACTQLGRFSINFLPATGPFDVFKIFNSLEQLTGEGDEYSPLGAFSFRTCAPSKYLINTSSEFTTIPFNTKTLWFSSLTISPAGQHFATQGISKSPLKLLQNKELITLKKSWDPFRSLFILAPKKSESQHLCQHWLQTIKPEISGWISARTRHICCYHFCNRCKKFWDASNPETKWKKKLKLRACGKPKRIYDAIIVTGTGKRGMDSFCQCQRGHTADRAHPQTRAMERKY